MDDIKMKKCLDILFKLESSEQKFKMIFQWVKQSHINFQEFKLLTDGLYR